VGGKKEGKHESTEQAIRALAAYASKREGEREKEHLKAIPYVLFSIFRCSTKDGNHYRGRE
jgi:hypothetical protein